MTERSEPTVGPITEETIIDTCGDRALPKLGIVEQVWETESILTNEIEPRAAR